MLVACCPGGGGVRPHKALIRTCRWMGSHFHNWIDHNGVTFSIELLEWGRIFSDFWGKTVLYITYKRTRMFVLQMKSKALAIQSKKWVNSQKWKVTKLGSVIGHRIDYNGIGVLRGQLYIPSKNKPK